MHLGVHGLAAEIAIEAADPRRRLVAPAVILHAFARHVERPVALAHAVLERAADPAVGAAQRIELEALIGEAVLHLEADGAAQRVQAERRIVGPDVGASDRDRRDEIPVDGVAERLVDADAVHVDREALRRALQGRGREAAVAQVLEEAVALHVGRVHAGDALHQRFDHARRVRAVEVLGGQRLHHGRDLVTVEPDAGHRRGGDDRQRRRGDGNWRGGRGGGRGCGLCRTPGRGRPRSRCRRRTLHHDLIQSCR